MSSLCRRSRPRPMPAAPPDRHRTCTGGGAVQRRPAPGTNAAASRRRSSPRWCRSTTIRPTRAWSRARAGAAAPTAATSSRRPRGLEPGQVAELESFGLVSPASEESGEPRFDDDALEVAKVAAGFFERGVEARHLRMYRTFAEREAMLFGQVLLPYTRQRNPDARARLQEELVELATLGRRLRTALLRDATRETLAE